MSKSPLAGWKRARVLNTRSQQRAEQEAAKAAICEDPRHRMFLNFTRAENRPREGK